jgi:hypothetical protein
MSTSEDSPVVIEFLLTWAPTDEKWVATCPPLEDLSYSSENPDGALIGLLTIVKSLRMAELVFGRNLTSDQVNAFVTLGDFDRDQSAHGTGHP